LTEELVGQLKLVIFDCDGTLVDSQVMIIKAMQQAFMCTELPVPGRDDIKSIIGLSLEEAVQRLGGLKDLIVIEALCKAYKKSFARLREEDGLREQMFAGGREFLRDLSGRDDILLGLATGKSRRGVDVLFEREELHGFFATIQTSDRSPSKPHPDMIERALAETGAARAFTYMIGDTSFDMAMARNARVGALGVSWGYHGPEELMRAGAQAIAHEFDDLETMMPRIFSKGASVE